MTSVPTWVAIVGFIVGPGSLLATAVLVFLYRKRDVTNTIDQRNITSQKELLETYEKDNIYLKGQLELKDEQIKSLTKQLDDQKADFQRQIDSLSKQIIEVKSNNNEITAISKTLQLFVPLTSDVEEFHRADAQIIDMLKQLMKKQGLTEHRDKR